MLHFSLQLSDPPAKMIIGEEGILGVVVCKSNHSQINRLTDLLDVEPDPRLGRVCSSTELHSYLCLHDTPFPTLFQTYTQRRKRNPFLQRGELGSMCSSFISGQTWVIHKIPPLCFKSSTLVLPRRACRVEIDQTNKWHNYSSKVMHQ